MAQTNAAVFGVSITEHSHAVQRAQELTQRLDGRIESAQRNGDLAFFNREFRQRRLQAQAEGRPPARCPLDDDLVARFVWRRWRGEQVEAGDLVEPARVGPLPACRAFDAGQTAAKA
jgi:hypothetical protein